MLAIRLERLAPFDFACMLLQQYSININSTSGWMVRWQVREKQVRYYGTSRYIILYQARVNKPTCYGVYSKYAGIELAGTTVRRYAMYEHVRTRYYSTVAFGGSLVGPSY